MVFGVMDGMSSEVPKVQSWVGVRTERQGFLGEWSGAEHRIARGGKEVYHHRWGIQSYVAGSRLRNLKSPEKSAVTSTFVSQHGRS